MNKVTKYILDAIYIGGSFGGAAIIAANIGLNVVGYVMFLSSSIAGIFLLRKSDASKSFMIVTVYYAIVNAVGIVRYLN